MTIRIEEIREMLGQFQRAALSTKHKCEASREAGYDTRRGADVAHAQGRLDALEVMNQELTQLEKADARRSTVSAQIFVSTFEAQASEAKRLLGLPSSPNFHVLFGRVEAFTDVVTTLELWGQIAPIAD